MLDIPVDVLSVVAEWGAEDPRTRPRSTSCSTAASARSARRGRGPAPVGGRRDLTMTVAETVDVLQLTEAQAKVLATLVRRVGVTITG